MRWKTFLTWGCEKKRGRLAPTESGRAGPNAQLGRLPWAPGGTARRTVTAQRARTHPQARGQRRRYVVQRRATIAAKFSTGINRAQPVASRRAFRIDALHSPAWQILHCFPLYFGGLHTSLEAFSVKVEPAPAGISRNLFPTRLPLIPANPKIIGKSCQDFALRLLWRQEQRYNS